jgi:hypothetical protein
MHNIFLPSRLVKIITRDNIMLEGLFVRNPSASITVIHVHGSFGNFYQNDFIPLMADYYYDLGMNFFTFNNRGRHCISESSTGLNSSYIGGTYEVFEKCVLDIQAAIDFTQTYTNEILLQGHSFGCQKVISYLLQSSKLYDSILLSPADCSEIQKRYIYPETINAQYQRLRNMYADNLLTILPPQEYGVLHDGEKHSIPICAATLLSQINSDCFRAVNYLNPISFRIDNQCFVYVGGEDLYQTANHKTIKKYFIERIKEPTFLFLRNGDHHFTNKEETVLKHISSWVKTRGEKV